MAVSQNERQQVDLNKIYGLDNCDGEGFGCDVKNTAFVATVSQPSLEQIASYVGDNTNQYPTANASNQMATQTNSKGTEVQFSNCSPIQGDIAQMYQPITKEQAELYPTPAVVAKENQNNMSAQNTSAQTYKMGKPTVDNNIPLADAITDFSNPYPVTRESIQYLNGFIRTQIGRRVTIDFLIGSNTIESKSGYLLAVAANYILINELDTDDVTACDFYNIKFIRFYY